MNFATLQGLTIPEGVVTQIADASGRVLWMLPNDEPFTLKVKKITASTYAGDTKYSNESFILLNVYPKTNGTVHVTYGDLTKTITDTSGAAEPNSQQVFFGTFNGVSDSVVTPASGGLTITGDCAGVACGSYSTSSKASDNYDGVTAIGNWEINGFTAIQDNAFKDCSQIKGALVIPNSVTKIRPGAFANCSGLTSITIPNSVTNIAPNPFYGISDNNILKIQGNSGYFSIEGNTLVTIANGTKTLCSGFANTVIPSDIKTIGATAFLNCTGLTTITIPASVEKLGEKAFSGCTNLQTIVILGTNPPSIITSSGMFPTGATIVVPKGYGETYKAVTGWKNFASQIVEAS